MSNGHLMTDIKKEPIVFYDYKNENIKSGLNEASSGTVEFINQKIASLQSLEEIIDFLFTNLQEIIPCDRIAVTFFEENGKRATIYYVKANYSDIKLEKGYSAEIDNSSLEKVFSDGTPRIINDLQEYLKTHPASDTTKLLVQEGINSSITTPLAVENRPVGLLFISSKEKNIYDRSHVIIHSLIVERIGQVVEKALRIEQLSDSINSYLEMLSFVSHELKSPLDSIITLGNTLAEGYFGGMDEKHKNYVLRMVNKAKFMKEMTTEYLTLSRFENKNVDIYPSEADFEKNILEESIEIVIPLALEKNITINRHITHGIRVECDVTLIKIVTNNLLSNAIKYGDEDGEIDITLTSDEKEATLSIRNTGPGFPEEAKAKLFRKFSRIEKTELMKRKGTGVGLYNSWKIIKLHNGKIWAESKENEWAEFSFRIPLKSIQKQV
jgi:signal transduction histidine kinase